MTEPKLRGPKGRRVEPEQLLDAAQAVFSRDGLRAASMRAIAKEAGCDPALIYYHFANKEAVVAALLDRTFPPLVQSFQALQKESRDHHTSERLWMLLGAIHDHMAQAPGFRALVRGELARGAEGIHGSIALRIKPVFEIMQGVLWDGIAKGEIRKELSASLGSFFFLRLYMEILDLVPLMSVQEGGAAPEMVMPLARLVWFDIFWRGIAAQPEEDLLFLARVRLSLQAATDRLRLALGEKPS